MKKRLVIEGMHCANCVKGLNAVLTEDVDGIEVIEINLDVVKKIIKVTKKTNIK